MLKMLFDNHFFSCVVDKDKNIYFTEIDTYDDIIFSKKLQYGEYLKVKYSKKKNKELKFEIVDNTPTWFLDEPSIIKNKVISLYQRILPIRIEYESLDDSDIHRAYKNAKLKEKFLQRNHFANIDIYRSKENELLFTSTSDLDKKRVAVSITRGEFNLIPTNIFNKTHLLYNEMFEMELSALEKYASQLDSIEGHIHRLSHEEMTRYVGVG